MNRLRLLKFTVLTLVGLFLGVVGSMGQTTLNPVADTDSQSDVAAGTNTTLNASQWCQLYLKFDLSALSNVSNAKLRIYQVTAGSAYTLNVNTTSNDTWTEGGTKPTAGTLIVSSTPSGAAGYIEIDVTSHVQSKMSGNKLVSVALTTSLGGWTQFYSRQNSTNKPQLVVTSGVAVTGVTVAPTSATVNVGATTTLTATVAPSNATNKNVSWSSSNTGVATVNSSGVVTGVAAGSATITVTTQDGGKTATCAVTVQTAPSITKYEAENAALTGVSVASAETGYTGTGYMDGNTFDATGDKIVFTVNAASAGSYPLVIRFKNTCGVCDKAQNVKVNGGSDVYTTFSGTTGNWQDLNFGNVSLNAGSNTIEINKSWGYTHIDYITVGTSGGSTVPVTGVSVSPTSASVGVGATTSLTATVAPSNATNKNVSWSSSNTGVATVNSSGVVTGVAAGSATITVTTQDGAKTATCAVTVTSTPPPTGVMQIGTNFWDFGWSPSTEYVQPNVNWATVTNPWQQAFLDQIAIYSCLRFMDFNHTNNSNVVNWSERIAKTANQVTAGQFAYEWCIDLCNRTGKDMWVCLPHKSNQDYWTQLATLIKNNLNPNLKCYVEYSNETWNGGFTQMQYCCDQGVANGLPGSNQWYQGGAYSVWQSLKIFKAFQDVFGASAMGTRVIRVCAWSGNYDIARQAFANTLNSSTWNPYGQKVDMGAIAPYIGNGIDGAASNVQTLFHNEIDAVYNNTTDGIGGAVSIANQFGFKLGCYEGGQHLLTNAHVWSANQNIYTEYMYMLNKWADKFVLFNHYTHLGSWSSGGAWGAKTSTAASLADSPKYRALVDWINSKKSAVAVETATSVETVAETNDVVVYPNPANDVVYVKANASQGRVTVFDRSGKMVKQQQTFEGVNELNVSSLANGLYFINVVNGNSSVTKKITIVR